MPEGEELVVWNPRIGETGDDRYKWPPDLPLHAGTPSTGFEDPLNPTIEEVNAAEGLNQIVAEIRRRTPITQEQWYPERFLGIEPMPFFESVVQDIPVTGASVWWDADEGTDEDPSVLSRDHVCADDTFAPWWYYAKYPKGSYYVRKPKPPGNGLAMTVAGVAQYLDTEYTGTMPPPTIALLQPLTSDIVTFIRKRLAADKIAAQPLCVKGDRFDLEANKYVQYGLNTSVYKVSVDYNDYPANGPTLFASDVYLGQDRLQEEPGTVYAVSTAPIASPPQGLQVIDGYQTVTNARIILKDQADPTYNGWYYASSGTWTKQAQSVNSRWLVLYGDDNIDKTFQITSNSPFTVADVPPRFRYEAYRPVFSYRIPNEPTLSNGHLHFTYRKPSGTFKNTDLVLLDLGIYYDISNYWQIPSINEPPDGIWEAGTALAVYTGMADDPPLVYTEHVLPFSTGGFVPGAWRTFMMATSADLNGEKPTGVREQVVLRWPTDDSFYLRMCFYTA